jgi:hypothetical protein
MILLVWLLLAGGALYAEESPRLILPQPDAPYAGDLQNFAENSAAVYVPFFESMGLKRVRTRTLKIRVFPDRESFKAYQKGHSQSQSDYAFYSLFDSEIVTFDSGNSMVLFSNIFHEASHHYLRDFLSEETIPRCLDEGIAEIFEVGTKGSGETPLAIGRPARNWVDDVRRAAEKNRLKGFPFFPGVTSREFIDYQDPFVPKLQIAQCWAQSHFLAFNKSGQWRPLLGTLLAKGVNRAAVEAILQKELPPGLTADDLDREWQAFVKNPG